MGYTPQMAIVYRENNAQSQRNVNRGLVNTIAFLNRRYQTNNEHVVLNGTSLRETTQGVVLTLFIYIYTHIQKEHIIQNLG